VGAVLGSFCAGFLLIPFLGKENGLRLVTGIQMLTAMVLAAYLLLANRRHKFKLVPIGALVVLGAVLCVHFPRWNHHLLAMGKYQRFERIKVNLRRCNWFQALLHGPEILTKSERSELVYYGDGIGGFTTVLKYSDPFGTIDYSLANSGKPDASSRADMKTQTLLAHFPMLFHRDPKTVMVLGLASGITARETLCYPIDRLDVLEISPQVVVASRFFDPWNNNVLSNPKTNLIVQDGRAHLQLTRYNYDVVISEPSNPWMAGLATLFTSDFFSLVKDRLNENGIFCQWVHSYQMDWPTFAMIGRTFASVFANSLLVSTAPSFDGHDFLLVGFKGIDRLTLLNAERNLPYVQQSSNITLRDPRLLYRLILSQDLRKLFGTGPVNTDSSPSLEFNAPKLMYVSDPNIHTNIKSAKSLDQETADIIRHVTTDIDSQLDFAAFALSVYSPFPNMVDLSRATTLQTEQFFALMEAYCAKNPIDYAVLKNDDLKRKCLDIQSRIIRRNIDLVPDKALSYLCLAQIYEQNNMPAKAIPSYLNYLEIEPDDAIVHHNLAHILGEQDRLDEAIHHYTQALKNDPYNAVTHSNLGVLLAKKQRFPEAVNHFTESLKLKPDFADAHSNLGYVLGRQGKVDEAVKHLTEALRINPNFAEAHYNLGFILSRRGSFDDAIAQFKETLRIDPNFVKARQGLEQALLKKRTTEQKSPPHSTDNPLQP
jgi:spermidine synthase